MPGLKNWSLRSEYCKKELQSSPYCPSDGRKNRYLATSKQTKKTTQVDISVRGGEKKKTPFCSLNNANKNKSIVNGYNVTSLT